MKPNSIKVKSGAYLDLADPDPAAIDLPSIAAGLANTCRFSGQCPKFYSVAEHCFHMTSLAKSRGMPREILVAALLHDASEAYLGDIVSPLKSLLPKYKLLEARMMWAIEVALGVQILKYASTVHELDMIMLKSEKLEMWPDDCEEWPELSNVRSYLIGIQYWTPEVAEVQFLRMAKYVGVYNG